MLYQCAAHIWRLCLALILSYSVIYEASLSANSTLPLFLTWSSDPLTTMTVQWIIPSKENAAPRISYKEDGSEQWLDAVGNTKTLPAESHLLQRIELLGLKPGTAYAFKIEGDANIYRFRTAPSTLDAGLRFIEGGDVYHHKDVDEMVQTHQMAAKQNPLFALVGGDIAYAAEKRIGGQDQLERWIEFFQLWHEHLRTADGFLIPIIPAIGNHDTVGRYFQTTAAAPHFYAFFPFPGETGCNVLDFADYLSLVILDSNHTHRLEEQKPWLAKVLAERQKRPHTFVCYHVPAYPSVREYDQPRHVALREQWVPLFEQYNVPIVFEHHEHSYKRTVPIRNGAAHPDGVVYLGDGGWGSPARWVKAPQQYWYLEATAARRHVIVVDIDRSSRSFKAVDAYNDSVFDTLTQKVVAKP